MRGETQLRYARVVDEPALHHVPAERTLCAAEDEDRKQRPGITGRNAATDEKPQIRQQEGKTDCAPEQPMRVLPPEDALERVEAHVRVDLPVFGRGAILGENVSPVGIGQRRQRADDRLPFGDRQAGVREARHAPEHDQREQQGTADKKPRCHRMPVARIGIGALGDFARGSIDHFHAVILP